MWSTSRQPFEHATDWYSFVKNYSVGQLTLPSDKLPAIAGVAEHFARGDIGQYLAGL